MKGAMSLVNERTQEIEMLVSHLRNLGKSDELQVNRTQVRDVGFRESHGADPEGIENPPSAHTTLRLAD